MRKVGSTTLLVVVILVVGGCYSKPVKEVFSTDQQLGFCVKKASQTIALDPGDSLIPRNIAADENTWNYVQYTDWTSGFWPGTLWYLYEYTKEEAWKDRAARYTSFLFPLSVTPALDHDLGFQVFNSYGLGYRLTGNEAYKEVILRTADTLATLYNPKVGTILSWPRPVPNMEWPQHNTIMDNMINLELLFWASKNGGDQRLYDMAVTHAETTMKNHFRPDYTSYHVVVYDRDTGKKIKGVTHQGYSDESMWARGQAWAIYGYTMVYRETRDLKYLEFAHKVVKPYLDNLPEDYVPYWDFKTPDIPKAPKDASAAAVVAAALLELADYSQMEQAMYYRVQATNMLKSLSSAYTSPEGKPSFLEHSTGHFPNGSEVDYSIIYADYYYIEALTRLKRVQAGKSAVL